jgi:hypothetical protein
MALNNNPKTQEELGDWAREQFQKANKHLAENGILFKSVVAEDSRYLAPLCAVWKIDTNEGKQFWVISGDMPSDYLPLSNAEDARTAIRHFSMKWQMQAETIRRQVTDKTQLDYAQLLETKAEALYEMHASNKLWVG